jgi:hypothetical protein
MISVDGGVPALDVSERGAILPSGETSDVARLRLPDEQAIGDPAPMEGARAMRVPVQY